MFYAMSNVSKASNAPYINFVIGRKEVWLERTRAVVTMRYVINGFRFFLYLTQMSYRRRVARVYHQRVNGQSKTRFGAEHAGSRYDVKYHMAFCAICQIGSFYPIPVTYSTVPTRDCDDHDDDDDDDDNVNLTTTTTTLMMIRVMIADDDHTGGNPDSKVHGANMGPIWVLSAPGGPHVGLMNLAIWEGTGQFLAVGDAWPTAKATGKTTVGGSGWGSTIWLGSNIRQYQHSDVTWWMPHK